MTPSIPEDLREFAREPILSDEECVELVKHAHQGDEYAITDWYALICVSLCP